MTRRIILRTKYTSQSIKTEEKYIEQSILVARQIGIMSLVARSTKNMSSITTYVHHNT